MDNSQPLVSICIPTYNRAGMVGKTIESALAQTYANIEILVVDNASNDDLESVMKTFHDQRVKFYRNPTNLGMYGNFNRCVELSTGKYIHILHSDDYIDSQFTRICVDFFEEHSEVAMTFGSILDPRDATCCTSSKKAPIIYSELEGFKKILGERGMIICPTVMVRRDVYEKIGLFSLEYPYSGDFYQWLRISRRYQIAYIPNAILFYRTGTHSESFQLLFKTPLGYIDTFKIFVYIVNELGENQKLFQHELNLAYQRHIRDCFFASVARSESMTHYSRMIFIGLALSTWSLIKSRSIFDVIKKWEYFFLIGAFACVITIPGGRFCIKKAFGFSSDAY